jgi:RNA polymerase sigma-70 factor (ECF subfamily)
MEPPQTDQRLLEAAIEAHADSMYRVAFRLTGDRERAEEIVQETFIGAWKGIRGLKEPDKIKSWLFGILRNQFHQSIERKQRILRTEPLQDTVASDWNTTDLQEQVQHALAELDEDHRLPILIVSMEGWSIEEAAEMLGIPKGTVLSRLHRGRQRLKEILTRELELKPE